MRHFEYNNRRYRNPEHVAMAGKKLRQHGNLRFATALLEAGLAHYEHSSDNHTIKLSLATCYRASGQGSKALPLLSDVVRAQPGNVFAHIELAKVHTTRGEYDLARTHGRSVLDAHPYNAHAMLALVQIESLSGQKKAAESMLARMENLDRRAPGLPKMLEIAENLVRQKSLLADTAVAEDQANRRAFHTAASEQAIMEVVHIPNPPYRLKLAAELQQKRKSGTGMHQQETGDFDMSAVATAFETAVDGPQSDVLITQPSVDQGQGQGLNATLK